MAAPFSTNSTKRRHTMSEPKVVFEAVPSRWRVENRIRDDKWVGDQCFPTLEAATAYAQKWLDNNPDGYAYRVVDTQPEAAVEAAPSRWRVDVTAPVKRWVPHALFNSREAAEAYAEALVKRADQRNLMARVVDTNPSDPVTVAIFEEDNV